MMMIDMRQRGFETQGKQPPGITQNIKTCCVMLVAPVKSHMIVSLLRHVKIVYVPHVGLPAIATVKQVSHHSAGVSLNFVARP